MAEASEVTLVLELLNSKVDHPDYQADHTAWGVGVCQAVGSPRVKLLYDIYHMQIMEGDVIRTLEAHHPLIGLYHRQVTQVETTWTTPRNSTIRPS